MNYQINFKEIFRWACRNKSVTILSIGGMAVGITVALLIGFWSLNEISFDKFHKDYDRIYRVCFKGFVSGESLTSGSVFGPLGKTAKEQFPEIDDMMRIVALSREAVKIKEVTAYEDQICATDNNLFNFFSFNLETGNSQTCLDGPDKIVIDRHFANRYFIDEDPIGQIIEIYGKKFQVSAVMKNVPENSHIKFHMLVPIAGIDWLNNSGWGSNDCFITYLKLEKGTNIDDLNGRITGMASEQFPLYKKFDIKHFLQPLVKIHLYSNFRFDHVITNDRRLIFILISIAALILLIACFNFINLFISTFVRRAKSIGVKKINGSSKVGLFASSYLETTFYVVIATLISLVLVAALMPVFNQLAGSNLRLDLSNYQVYLYTGTLILLTIAVAGTFPVLYVVGFNPNEIIRNQIKGRGITPLQKALVVSQFAASILFISSAIIIKNQIHFVKNKDLGFNKNNLIYFPARNMADNFHGVREEMMKNPDIAEVTAKESLPSVWVQGWEVTTPDNPGNKLMMEICRIQYNYSEVLNIPVISGRNPFIQGKAYSDECMINEKAVEVLNIQDPIGKQITVGVKNKTLLTIAGVLKNINSKSLHLKIDPQVYLLDPLEPSHMIMVKTTGNSKGAINALSAIWSKYNPDVPFEYNFLDDTYDKLYKTEERASVIISIGMIIALLLAFTGLYAISHYATEQRIKEIGIRKVNGAEISEIMSMLNKDFVKWVLISFLIATPLGWYAMHKWLENFAFRISLSWWIFALAGLVALGIALLTVSWQSWKAATRNPVEALRYE